MKKKKKYVEQKRVEIEIAKIREEEKEKERVDRFYDPRASSRLSTAKSTIIRLEEMV